jgi:hypothetical protein
MVIFKNIKMKITSSVIGLIFVFFCFSCSKELEVNEPDLAVSVEKQTVKLGDTVHFQFSGHADYITFYAGEDGSAYPNRFRTKIESAKPQLEFTSLGKFGTQLNTLRLLISTNFNGKVVKDDIYAADWIDITDRANLSTGADMPSGVIDLSDFTDHPQVNIAFKWVAKNLNNPQKSWWITNFSLKTIAPDGKVLPLISTLSEGGWLAHSVEGDARKWRITAADLYIGANANEADNEDWVITKAINLAAVNPDKGLPIKDLSGPVMSHSHIYTKPGIYKATFVMANTNVYDAREVVKEVEITVEEE